MILTGDYRSTWRKPCLSATLSTTNSTWTDTGSNPGLRDATEKLPYIVKSIVLSKSIRYTLTLGFWLCILVRLALQLLYMHVILFTVPVKIQYDSSIIRLTFKQLVHSELPGFWTLYIAQCYFPLTKPGPRRVCIREVNWTRWASHWHYSSELSFVSLEGIYKHASSFSSWCNSHY
jgi:hypothetical protein